MGKNFGNSIGIVLGIAFIYFGVTIFLEHTSENKAYMGNTYISKVKAELKFFHDKEGTHKYLEKGKLKDQNGASWSSEKYPRENSYSELKISSQANPDPAPVDILQTTIYVTRSSH